MLQGDKRAWYAALTARDTRFDGRFFVGVSSTRIYCRPVCRAKRPKAEHCTFYETAAEAERAGYRPCLLCRPELAPGSSITDATASLARRAARILEESCGGGQSLAEIAERLGCTDRHLRRVFTEEYNVSPVQYLQTCRLLMAKSLLTDTDLSILDVAMASGFGSLRRFNDLFQKHYRFAPSALRKQLPGDRLCGSDVTVALGYRPPYRWQQMLDFLSLRAIPGVEAVRDGEYLRTACFINPEGKQLQGWIRVHDRPARNMLGVTVSASLLPVLPQVLARVRHLFDLCCDPDAVTEVLAPMNDIRPGFYVPGTRVPGCFEPFEMAVRSVLGQQITVKAARALAARLVEAYGMPVETGIDGLTHVFPSPARIIALEAPIGDRLGPLGITGARARTILALAQAFAAGDIDFDLSARPEAEIGKLMAMPGIGGWTAQYIAMRTMGWPDAFLETDVGVRKALAPHTPKEMLTMAEAWRPWRSYATVNLWNAL